MFQCAPVLRYKEEVRELKDRREGKNKDTDTKSINECNEDHDDNEAKVQPLRPLSRSSPPTSISNFREKVSNRLLKRIPQFKTLPIDIRLLIWEMVLPDGAVHEIHPCSKLMVGGKMMFRSNHGTPPAILSVCQESRRIALQNLKVFYYRAPTDTKRIRPFYFNPRRDTLFLNTLMGLYMAFMLLEAEISDVFDAVEAADATEEVHDLGNKEGESEVLVRKGVMGGWENVALDADRAQLLE
jgi:hypothetical protein